MLKGGKGTTGDKLESFTPFFPAIQPEHQLSHHHSLARYLPVGKQLQRMPLSVLPAAQNQLFNKSILHSCINQKCCMN